MVAQTTCGRPNYNKTTETQSKQRKVMPFYQKKAKNSIIRRREKHFFYDCSLLRICGLQFVELTLNIEFMFKNKFNRRANRFYIKLFSLYLQ